MSKYTFYSLNSKLYDQMLKDIKDAASYVYLETYLFQNDAIGREVLALLIKKAKEGVRVKILLDSIGSLYLTRRHFKELVSAGGEIAFFKKIRFGSKLWKDLNQRDHRKILVIDDRVAFVGSSNIVENFKNWRELNVRIENSTCHLFREIFLQMFDLAKTHYYSKRKAVKAIKTKEYEIIRDVPSLLYRPVRNRVLEMIRHSKSKIWIETPYLVPEMKMIRELMFARRRGVKIKIILPEYADHKSPDVLNKHYLAKLCRLGIDCLLYVDRPLHSKLVVADGEKFLFGSANMDYRSFILQFEIALYGKGGELLDGVKRHFK